MTQSTSTVARRGDIQGLRAIAVLLVVGYHADIGPPGWFFGVDVFFIMSGYVITLGLLSEIEASGSIDLGRFMRQRVRRLLPALAESAGVMATNATILDFFDTICPDEECATKAGDQWMFRDGGHISVDLSTKLANQFSQPGS